MSDSDRWIVDEIKADRNPSPVIIGTRSAKPDDAARANRLARQLGLPPATVERNLPDVAADAEARRTARIVSSGSDKLQQWYSDPRNAAAAKDDAETLKRLSDHFQSAWSKPAGPAPGIVGAITDTWKRLTDSNYDAMRGQEFQRQITAGVAASADAQSRQASTADGFLDRALAMGRSGVGQLEAGLYTVGAALKEWSANNPLPWTSQANIDREKESARQLRMRAELLSTTAPVRGATTWEQVKQRPSVGNIAAFGIEQSVQSLPGMATAMFALPAYVASQSGQIGQQRAQNNGQRDASIVDVALATPAAVGSAFLERLGIESIFAAPGKNALRRTLGAAAGEASTEFAQGGVEYAGGAVGTKKGATIGAALDQMASGALAGAFMGGTIRGAHEGAGRIRAEVRTYAEANRAQAQATVMDSMMQDAAASKLRERDPEAFRDFVAQHTDSTAVENVYIPAEAVRDLMQDGYRDDPFWGDYADQIDEAIALGGDVVVPTADIAARLAGTPEWAKLQPEARFSPGGMSEAELRSLEESHAGYLDQAQSVLAEQIQRAATSAEPAAQVYTEVRDALANAGFAPDAADRYAQLWAANRETWAARMGTQPHSGITLYHGSARNDLTRDGIQIIRTEGQKQGKKGRVYGGFYAADEASMSDAQGYAGESGTVYAIDLRHDAVIEEKQGDITRLSEAAINEYRSRGVDVVKGKDPRGRTEYAIINRDAITRVADRNAPRPGPMTALDYHRTNPVQFRRILPETLGRVQAADGLDMVINAMRRGKDAKASQGKSLLEWIAQQGGVTDPGGDIASMGGKDWHKAAKFRRKLIRESNDAQGSMLGADGQQNTNSPDELAMRAWEAGYFPEANGRPDVNQFLDAIGSELRGTPRYAQAAEGSATQDMRTAANELRAMLEQRGVDPDKATPAQIKASVAEMQASASDAGRGLDQEARGRARISDTPGATIELFQGADLSTVIHESGHVWLEEFARNAAMENAPADVKDDWQTIKDWFADNGHPIGEDGHIPTEAHELFARGWERYAMEGKPPSSSLQRVFDAFRGWLLTIYKHVANLRVDLTPEVRGVFDRMLATQDAIDEETQRQGMRSLFTDAAQAGMTEAEFAAYQQSASEARSEAFNALLYKTMHRIRQERTKAWKAEEATVRGEVSSRINAMPEFRALHLLRTGRWLDDPEREPMKVRLDKSAIVDTYGEDALSQLPKGVPPIYADGGMDLDTAAELVGFRNGDEMVRSLMGLERTQAEMRASEDKRSVRQRMIEEETSQIMTDRHGDVLTDGSIEEEALAAINNDRQGEIMASELRQLGKQRGRAPTPYQLARQWAARKIAEGKVVDVASRSAMQRYARATAKAARSAEAAMLEGDIDETFRQKQAQLLNHALLAEAKKAADNIDKIVERMGKIAKRATMKSVDQEYLDRAHALLEKFDFRQKSQAFLDERESFAEWAARQTANGFDVVTPPRLEGDGVHYTRMSVEELQGLADSVDQVMHLGRLKQKLVDGKAERDHNEVVGEAVEGAGQLKQRPPSDMLDQTWGDAIRHGVASADAALLKMETVFDWLDGGKSDGVFQRVAFRPIAEAQDRENDMLSQYLGKFREIMGEIPKETLRRWDQRISVPELLNRETGNPFTLSRQQLVSIALNMGNAGNLQRLVDGYGWNEAGVRRALDRELTEPEWQFVQKTWDLIGGLWPEIAALEKRINGVEPEKVEPVPVETRFGTFPGGYYPAVYDATRSMAAERREGESADLFSSAYSRANTAASATKARADKVRQPILLDLGVISRHLTETIHDVTHREAVMNADKFLSDPKVQTAVDNALGREIRQQFRPWLKYVANRFAIERAGNEGLGKFINKARANATIVGMGFRFSTVMSQIAGYSNTAEYVGPKWIAHGIGAFARDMVGSTKFAMEKSGELRHRMDTLDRDVGLVLRGLQGRSDLLTAGKRFAFHGIGYMDRIVSVPTWLGAYAKALDAGMSEADAIYEGDKAIRLSQGAGSAKDLAAVQRGTGKHGELLKLMTMYYSYVSTVYQRQRTLARDAMDVDARQPRNIPKLAARAFFLIALPPVLAELLSGRGPEDDEDWGWWAFEKMLAQSLGALPGFRDLVQPIYDTLAGKRAFDYQLSPLQSAGQSLVNVAKDVKRVSDGEDTTHATRDVLQAAGYTTGLVPGQVATSAQFFVDLGYGDQDPQTVSEWYKGITTGKSTDERAGR